MTTVIGVVNNPYTQKFEAPGAGLYFVTGLIFLVTTPFLYFKCNYTKPYGLQGQANKKAGFSKEKINLHLIFIISVFAILTTVPTILQTTSKVEMLESRDNIYIGVAYGTLPILGFILSYRINNKKYIGYFVFVVLLVFVLGSRRAAALSLICYVLICLEGMRFAPIFKWKVILVGIFSLVFIVLGKTYYSYFLIYGISGTKVWLDNFSYQYFITGNELLGRSAILNSVIENRFAIDGVESFKSFLAIQPLPLKYFSFKSSYFNDEFQSVLFPGINYGMAYNPWAEAYSWGGEVGVLIYATIIPYLLYKLKLIYKRSSLGVSSIVMLIAVIIAFWVHRNSLATELAYIRNALYPSIVILFFSYIFYRAKLKFKNNK